MPQPIFLIVEDHFNLQKGTQSTLKEYFPECECLLASSPKESISILSKQQCDLALIDLEYKTGDNGFDHLKFIRKIYPQIKCIIYSGYRNKSILKNVKQYQAHSYISKDAEESVFVEVIEKVLENDTKQFFESPCYLTYKKEFQKAMDTIFVNDFELDQNLTSREKEIAHELEKDPKISNNELADTLLISPKTLKKHLQNIYSKLRLHSKKEVGEFQNRKKSYQEK